MNFKSFYLLLCLFVLNHFCICQGSADQWKYNAISNPSGIRYANFFSSSDYKNPNASATPKSVYYPPAETYGIKCKNKGKLWGYADDKGHWLIKPQWVAESEFKDRPWARVTVDLNDGGKARLIDRSGKFVTGEFYPGSGTGRYLAGYKQSTDSTGKKHIYNCIYNLQSTDSIIFPEGFGIEREDYINNSTNQDEYYRFVINQSTKKVIGIISFPNLKISTDNLSQYDYVSSMPEFDKAGEYLKAKEIKIDVRKGDKWATIDPYGREVVPLH